MVESLYSGLFLYCIISFVKHLCTIILLNVLFDEIMILYKANELVL